jgi:RNA polymerase sigma factor (TIGR02999 family)
MAGEPRTRFEELLRDLECGAERARRAADELLPQLYDELRGMARRKLEREPRGQTLQATALVHEAYLRLVGDRDPGWSGRAHFLGAAAEAMHRILVERARAKGRLKRGGGRTRVDLTDVATLDGAPNAEVIALDEALARLESRDVRKAKVVVLRYFGGLSIDEIAQALSVSPTTVKSDWNFSLAWLQRELEA